ncbi:hypothetical protein J0S82_009293, partial [Galemys pyrenaicus]
MMKLNISFSASGYQELIEMDDECKCCTFNENHMVTELLLTPWSEYFQCGHCKKEKDILGLTDIIVPPYLGPKRHEFGSIAMKKQCAKKKKGRSL